MGSNQYAPTNATLVDPKEIVFVRCDGCNNISINLAEEILGNVARCTRCSMLFRVSLKDKEHLHS